MEVTVKVEERGSQQQRARFAIPVQIESKDGRRRIGIARPLSRSGAVILSNSRCVPGDELAVRLSREGSVEGAPDLRVTVVHVDRRSPDLCWRCALTLAFHRPVAAEHAAAECPW